MSTREKAQCEFERNFAAASQWGPFAFWYLIAIVTKPYRAQKLRRQRAQRQLSWSAFRDEHDWDTFHRAWISRKTGQRAEYEHAR